MNQNPTNKNSNKLIKPPKALMILYTILFGYLLLSAIYFLFIIASNNQIRCNSGINTSGILLILLIIPAVLLFAILFFTSIIYAFVNRKKVKRPFKPLLFGIVGMITVLLIILGFVALFRNFGRYDEERQFFRFENRMEKTVNKIISGKIKMIRTVDDISIYRTPFHLRTSFVIGKNIYAESEPGTTNYYFMIFPEMKKIQEFAFVYSENSNAIRGWFDAILDKCCTVSNTNFVSNWYYTTGEYYALELPYLFPEFIRWKTFSYLGYECISNKDLYISDDGYVSYAMFAEDVTFDRITYAKYKPIDFGEVTNVLSGYLASNTVIEGIWYSCNDEIEFYPNGKVESGLLLSNTTIDGITYSGNYSFQPGQWGFPAKNTTIDGITYMANKPVEFRYNVELESGYLLTNTMIFGIYFLSNEKVWYGENHEYMDGDLAYDTNLNGKDYSAGDFFIRPNPDLNYRNND